MYNELPLEKVYFVRAKSIFQDEKSRYLDLLKSKFRVTKSIFRVIKVEITR